MMLWCCCKQGGTVINASIWLPTRWRQTVFGGPTVNLDPVEALVIPVIAVLSESATQSGGVTFVVNNIPDVVTTAVLTVIGSETFWFGSGSDFNIYTWLTDDPSQLDPPWLLNEVILIPRNELSTPVHWEQTATNWGTSPAGTHDTPDIATLINQAIAAAGSWNAGKHIAILLETKNGIGERRSQSAYLTLS